MYGMEQSSSIARFFLSKLHPWNMTVWHGSSSRAPSVEIATYHRPLRMPLAPLKCCCHQAVLHHDAAGKLIGETVENFYCCVPMFDVRDGQGNIEYVISQPTCMDGNCVDCFAEGVFNLRIPFYVYEQGAQHVTGQEVARIVKVWSGLSSELCTDADNFELNFNNVNKPVSKARLLGSLFLLNQLFFEGKSSVSCL